MCGIAGFVSRAPLGADRISALAAMNEAMVHRGPDGAGRFERPHVALAMRRLSIIDTAHGWQPLYNEDQSVAVIANGEIYNFVELRQQLLAGGHRFRTGSDCEMIAHLYEDHGERCVEFLRGMFAFALWDSRRGRLLLARDRMGEKPLYLHESDGELMFASELRSLMRSGRIPFRLDLPSIDLYFHYQYVPEPSTPIEGVRKLPAGHVLTVTVEPWSVTQSCYWRMEDAPPLDGDPAERIRDALESISEIVIRSDVPVGVALSGGLDSSAIAVLAARRYPGTMHAFTVGYSGRPHTDEREDARALARHLGMPFHEVELETAEMVRSFPDVVYACDDPIADISAYGYYSISRAAHEAGVPVLLQGQGGDELFWGYDWAVGSVRQSLRKARLDGHAWAMLPEYARLTWPRLRPRRAPFDWLVSCAGLRDSWEAFQRDRSSPRERLVFYDLTREFRRTANRVGDLYAKPLRERLEPGNASGLFTLPLPWPNLEILVTRLVCQTYLLENGIAQGDRLSMASSVELRLPLVDYRLVETVIGLRKAHSDLGLPRKSWFRDALKDVVPAWVLQRRKRGFQPPVRAWVRGLFARYGSLLEDGALVRLGVLEPRAAAELARGPHSLTEGLPLSYRALVLEIWSRRFESAVSGAEVASLREAR